MNNHSSESSTGVDEENAFAGYSQLGADPTVGDTGDRRYERSGVVAPPPTSEDEEGASPSSSAAEARVIDVFLYRYIGRIKSFKTQLVGFIRIDEVK